jgi:hypothetical protein
MPKHFGTVILILNYIRTYAVIDFNIINKWAGHTIRASDNRTIKKILNTKSGGNGKVGRPRLRWEECVWQDIRILGVKNWRNVASNGQEWRAILRKARAHKGLSFQ